MYALCAAGIPQSCGTFSPTPALVKFIPTFTACWGFTSILELSKSYTPFHKSITLSIIAPTGRI